MLPQPFSGETTALQHVSGILMPKDSRPENASPAEPCPVFPSADLEGNLRARASDAFLGHIACAVSGSIFFIFFLFKENPGFLNIEDKIKF